MTGNQEKDQGKNRLTLPFFILLIIALLPANLILGLSILPEMKVMAAAQKESEKRIKDLQEIVSLTYFSIDPKQSGVTEALNHLLFWGDKKASSSHIIDQEACNKHIAMAEDALFSLGATIVPRLGKEGLLRRPGLSLKHYRKSILQILARLDRKAAIEMATAILEDPTFTPQSRIFAAMELLKTARQQGVIALRRTVKDYTDRSMPRGYPEMLGLYLNQTTDPERGEIIVNLLTERDNLASNTFLALIKGAKSLEPTAPNRDKVAGLLAKLFKRDDGIMKTFKASLLIRPLMESHRREILRTLKEIMPFKQFRSFLAGIKVISGVSPGFKRLMEKMRREAGL